MYTSSAAAWNPDAVLLVKAGGPGGAHSPPEVRTIVRTWPQQGCSGFAPNCGGVGRQPAAVAGTRYEQLS